MDIFCVTLAVVFNSLQKDVTSYKTMAPDYTCGCRFSATIEVITGWLQLEQFCIARMTFFNYLMSSFPAMHELNLCL